MKFIINGESREVAANTLASLMTVLDYEGSWLATAVNGEVVPAKGRDKCALQDGDRIEILAPMKGG